MKLFKLLAVLPLIGVLTACGSRKETTDIVWLNHFIAGQIRVAPETKVDADNVTFYEQGTDNVIPIDQLLAGKVYDFSKTDPKAESAVVIVITFPNATEPTHISVAKGSDTLRCPDWAVRFFGKKCEAENYDITYP